MARHGRQPATSTSSRRGNKAPPRSLSTADGQSAAEITTLNSLEHQTNNMKNMYINNMDLSHYVVVNKTGTVTVGYIDNGVEYDRYTSLPIECLKGRTLCEEVSQAILTMAWSCGDWGALNTLLISLSESALEKIQG